jgi:hypothetical protein
MALTAARYTILVKLTLVMSEGVTVNMTGGSPTLYLSDGATTTYDGAASIRRNAGV